MCPHPRPGPRFLPATVVLAFLATIAAVSLGAGVAAAQSVPRLAGQITDQAGVLQGDRASLEHALDSLLTERGVQLYAAFVPTTGSQTASDFAAETFLQNGLGGNDLLLLVAVGDRRYGWWEDGAIGQLSSDSVDGLLSSTLEPRFRAGDYAGGVADFASGLGRALAQSSGSQPAGGGPVAPVIQPTAQPVRQAPAVPAAPPIFVWGLVGLVLVLAGVMILVGAVRRRRLEQLTDEERDVRTGQLARQANSLLIAADDGVRDLQQELGFAEAEFDAAEIEPIRAAIGRAQDELKAAFTIRQQLDDEVPEDPPTRERMLNEIVTHCRSIAAAGDEQRKRISELRDLDRRAPEVLAGVPGQVTGLQARLPAAQATIERLEAYAPTSWQPVRGNLEEARKRIDFASATARRGASALAGATPDVHAGRAAARAAQAALAQAAALLDAIERMAASLDQARDRLEAECRAAAEDVTAARAALRAQPDAQLASRLDDAEAKLATARQEAGAPTPDVLAAFVAAQQAHAAADQALAGIREAATQRARQEAALQAALTSAQASVTHAADYIDSRRSGIGREARTRLAEAQRNLQQAQAAVATDPGAALRAAQRAQQLGDEAYRLASSDFDDWDGGGRRRGDPTGAIIGGIILGSILGNAGRRGGGFGGTPWGMPGRGGFGRGGGGGFGGIGRGGGGGWGGGRGGGGSW